MKIRLIEYKCIVNDKGRPFGHSEKAIEDAIRICNNLGFDVEVAASGAFKESSITLPNSIRAADYQYKNIAKIMKNLRVATSVKKNENTIFWYTNVDWYLFLFLALKTIRHKTIATIYKERCDLINGFEKKKSPVRSVLNKLLRKGIKKVDLYLETFYSNDRKKDAVYLPDYIYTDFYNKFRTKDKIKRVVCPGTINTQKDIRGLVSVFNQIDYPLLIIGEFVSSNLYDEVTQSIGSNIVVENRRLEYEEYYKIIAESMYCITPYDMNKYKTATSGVIREAVYLNTNVIAPQKLLNNMGMNGVGYEKLDDLISIFSRDVIGESIYNSLEQYKEEYVIRTVGSAILKLDSAAKD